MHHIITCNWYKDGRSRTEYPTTGFNKYMPSVRDYNRKIDFPEKPKDSKFFNIFSEHFQNECIIALG